MDVLTPEQRHKNMSNIRSKNTKPERILMAEIKKRGIYFTKHRKDVPGKPDIVFKRRKIAIFIDSDFWHRNPERYVPPKTNTEFWEIKTSNNFNRDRKIDTELQNNGWQVLRIWEIDIKKDLSNCMDRILTILGMNKDKS